MDINGGGKNRVFLHDLIKITEGTAPNSDKIPKVNVKTEARPKKCMVL